MKKHTIWIIELLVWGLVIFGALFVSMYCYNKEIRRNHTYYVFFKDVDGLIKGSPVKIQGYQIGYVSNISLINDEAFVTFIVTDKKVHIPNNLSASVAFTGMGGSKSLELSIAEKNNKNKKYINTVEPKRINDFYFYQNQIARLLVSMTSDIMNMINDSNTERILEFISKPEVLNDMSDILKTIEKNEDEYLNSSKKFGIVFNEKNLKGEKDE